ncbi:MAG: MBL fold metallo-hydrolase [Bradyrhizobium sp.]|uniref:MBL fold metallo-hydrolase n=1 Tax=Bradyrhizobium sp. TaxID=376 RepID=UPI002731DA80|nr:MBL fold metallo-hydrolase [Bradyrhizobium sp.]MDP1869651.1 MBL fold metallo-hydrolase [Bradyrhizobium sp.]
MHNKTLITLLIGAVTTGLSGIALAQTPVPAPAAPPLFATTKVEGTDNVYIFRYQNHQAMFIVTPAGVIATDPISYGRPQAAKTYLEEIGKITKAPVKYLIYSHHHYDHIAGGKPFKDAGAKVVAHKRAKERLATLKGLDVVIPDEAVNGKRTITLGGTTLELVDTGRNHSDSSLVMFLPKEKIIFAVDFNSLGAVPSRLAVNDSYPTEWEASLKRTLALKWDRQIPGHPGPGGRLGTREDMEKQLAFMTDLSTEVKKAADAGKCFDPAGKEVRLPQYGTLTGYEANIEWNIHRWCGYWGRGI